MMIFLIRLPGKGRGGVYSGFGLHLWFNVRVGQPRGCSLASALAGCGDQHPQRRQPTAGIWHKCCSDAARCLGGSGEVARLWAFCKFWAGPELGMRNTICDSIIRRLASKFNGGLVWNSSTSLQTGRAPLLD